MKCIDGGAICHLRYEKEFKDAHNAHVNPRAVGVPPSLSDLEKVVVQLQEKIEHYEFLDAQHEFKIRHYYWLILGLGEAIHVIKGFKK